MRSFIFAASALALAACAAPPVPQAPAGVPFVLEFQATAPDGLISIFANLTASAAKCEELKQAQIRLFRALRNRIDKATCLPAAKSQDSSTDQEI